MSREDAKHLLWRARNVSCQANPSRLGGGDSARCEVQNKTENYIPNLHNAITMQILNKALSSIWLVEHGM